MTQMVGTLSAIPGSDFTWNIPNFHRLSRDIDYSVESPTFCWNNAIWRLLLFPNGNFDWDTESMVLCLVREGKCTFQSDRVAFTLSMLGRNGCVFQENRYDRTFSQSDNICGGILEGVDRSTAQMEAKGPNSELSFSCDFNVPSNMKVDSVSSSQRLEDFPGT